MVYPREKTAKYLALPVAVFAVSTAAILIRFSGSHPLLIAFYRMFFSMLLFLPLFINNLEELKKLDSFSVVLISVSGISLGFHFALWIYSLQFTTIASSVVLVSSHPLLVLFLSEEIFNESFDKRAYYSVIFTLVGVFLIVLGDLRVEEWSIVGDFLALGGMVFLAIYLIIGRKVRKKVSASSYVFLVYLVSSLLLGGISFRLGKNFLGHKMNEYLIFFSLAFIPTLFGHSVYNWALKYVSPDLVSISLLGEPVLSTILAIFFFNEIPPSLSFVGFFVTIVGIYLSLKLR